MASVKLLPLAMLLLATSLGASSQLVSATKGATPPGFDAEAECRRFADYPKFCENLVKAYKPTSDEGLVEAAVNEGIGRARGAKKAFDVLLKSNKDESVADPLSKCSMVFDGVADKLGESLRRTREGREKSGILRIYIAKNALTFCYDIFDPAHEYNGLMDFPGKRTYTKVTKVVANALSLACGFKPEYCTHL